MMSQSIYNTVQANTEASLLLASVNGDTEAVDSVQCVLITAESHSLKMVNGKPTSLIDKIIELGHPELRHPDDFKTEKMMAILLQVRGLQFTLQRPILSEMSNTKVVFLGDFNGFNFSRIPLLKAEIGKKAKVCNVVNCCTEIPYIKLVRSGKHSWDVMKTDFFVKEIGRVKKKRLNDRLELTYRPHGDTQAYVLAFRKPKPKLFFLSCCYQQIRPTLIEIDITTNFRNGIFLEVTKNACKPKEEVKIQVDFDDTIKLDDIVALTCLLQVMSLELTRY